MMHNETHRRYLAAMLQRPWLDRRTRSMTQLITSAASFEINSQEKDKAAAVNWARGSDCCSSQHTGFTAEELEMPHRQNGAWFLGIAVEVPLLRVWHQSSAL